MNRNGFGPQIPAKVYMLAASRYDGQHAGMPSPDGSSSESLRIDAAAANDGLAVNMRSNLASTKTIMTTSATCNCRWQGTGVLEESLSNA